MKLERHFVEKPWGRTDVPSAYGAPAGKRIGEVWFTGPEEFPLLAKYIFTSERLSIQVHPNDEQARERGYRAGKSECWLILDAEPDASIALGLKQTVDKKAVRDAALDGSIEDLLDWRPVRRGDFFYVPAGTIHAIGAGIQLLEFQQNTDLTYRLYDYGRPRELHLDDAISVARPSPYDNSFAQHVEGDVDSILIEAPAFDLVQSHSDALAGRRRWVLPLDGRISVGADCLGAGDCAIVEANEAIEANGASLIIGAAH